MESKEKWVATSKKGERFVIPDWVVEENIKQSINAGFNEGIDKGSKATEEYYLLLLYTIEDKIDKVNGLYGEESGLCVYCGARRYTSRVGIVHKKSCVINEIRNEIEIIKEKHLGAKK